MMVPPVACIAFVNRRGKAAVPTIIQPDISTRNPPAPVPSLRRAFSHPQPPNQMNPFDLWPWALLLGLAVFAFFLLGPFLAGLLLILLIIVTVANLITG